jgi:Ssp1 endopeptidase immunity protein Rap1a
MKTLCVIGVVLLLLAALAAAGNPLEHDGNELLAVCRDAVRIRDAGGHGSAQAGYNAGYCDALVESMPQMYVASFCLPQAGIGTSQAVRIIVRYLESHPERLHLNQKDLLIEAFRDAFPCPPAPQPAPK